jgi:endonuclease-3 related protein
MIRFDQVQDALLGEFGPQHWWPADDVFEIIVGALLVQRTAWRNVEAAIAHLKTAGLLDPDVLRRTGVEAIEQCIKSTGFFRTKAGRLKNLAACIVKHGGTESLASLSTPEMRSLLLQVDGVGPETADAILLYAFNRPVVVIDEYLRRLARRLTPDRATIPDNRIRAWVAGTIDDVVGLNELHALVIAHGKKSCGRVPDCPQCAIRSMCGTGRTALEA